LKNFERSVIGGGEFKLLDLYKLQNASIRPVSQNRAVWIDPPGFFYPEPDFTEIALFNYLLNTPLTCIQNGEQPRIVDSHVLFIFAEFYRTTFDNRMPSFLPPSRKKAYKAAKHQHDREAELLKRV
jgi:hypothetical protein